MTSKHYVLAIVCGVLGLIGPFIAYNFIVDDFGLFWSSSPKRIWTQEKTTKYLMSFRYIPKNFDGLLIGPSYSDGLMNTRAIEGFQVYNLSMDGGNATELRMAAVNALQRGHFKLLIICLTPYITKDSGIKGSQINVKEYWGSLFSLLPVEMLMAKWQRHEAPADDLLRDSDHGSASLARPVYAWNDFVRNEIDDPLENEVRVDPAAYRDLKSITDAAHRRGIRVFAYYFPNSVWRSASAVGSGDWAGYQRRVQQLLSDPADVVWDMMGPDYRSLREDAACYTDGHLSEAGARLVMADINRQIANHLRNAHLPPVFPRSTHLACLGTPGAGSGFDRSIRTQPLMTAGSPGSGTPGLRLN